MEFHTYAIAIWGMVAQVNHSIEPSIEIRWNTNTKSDTRSQSQMLIYKSFAYAVPFFLQFLILKLNSAAQTLPACQTLFHNYPSETVSVRI